MITSYKRTALLLVSIGIACALLFVVSGRPYIIYLIQLVAINLIVVYGLNVVMGFAGQATVGHAALFAIGAYTSALLAIDYGWPLILSGVAAIIVPLIAALFLAFPSFKLGGVYLAVLTIAFNIIVHQLIINLERVTKGSVGIPGIPPILPNSVGPVVKILPVLALVYIAYRVNKNILRSFFVRELWAIRENEALASAFGVNPYWTKIIAFEISAVFAGLGGFCYGHVMAYISPDMGSFFVSVMFVMMLIAGGAGTLIGPIIGAIVITMIPELMHELEYFSQSIFGLLLILIALFFPKGLYGLVGRFLPEDRRKPQEDLSPARSASPSRWAALPGEGTLLTVESIGKSFGGVQALSSVSLDVKQGNVHAVIGPNGSGKTTLINIISGFLRPDYGKVVLAGESLAVSPGHEIARKGITRTFQNLSLLEDQTVMENVLLGLHPWWRGSLVQALLGTRRAKVSESEKEAFCYGFIERLGIEPLAYKKVSELSYGQRKLVETCRALVSQPRVLLLDEPTSGLSQTEIGEFIDLLRKVKETGVTIILVEHHIDIVESISDSVTVLDEGLVIAQGTYKEIARNPKVIEAYLGETQAA